MADMMYLALEYQYRTETYDRSISTIRSVYSGDALPRDTWERGQMTTNAHSVLADICRREQIRADDLLPFIRRTSHYSYGYLEHLFKPKGSLISVSPLLF